MAKSQVSMTVNGKTVEALVEPRTLLIHFLREQLNLTGPHIGCDTSHCGACTVDLDGKSVKILHDVRRAGERRRHPHHRGHGGGRRHAACAAGRLPRDARPAMRLLHAGDDRARLPAAAGEREPVRGGDPLRHRGQPLPLHRLPEHRQGHSIRRRQDQRRSRSRRPQNERPDPHLRATRRGPAGHGLQAQARRGYPLRPGQGQLCRRPQAARHALRRLHALAARACPRQDRSTPRRPRRCRASSRCSPPKRSRP